MPSDPINPATGDKLPDPPVQAGVDLKDFPFTPIYRARLFGSAFHAKTTDAEWRAGVTLWLKSQDQVPAGSLPNDDVELCRLAELGRDLRTWKRIRPGALLGWDLHSDGRLYHKVVAEVVNDQWQGKLDQRQRTLKARIAALEQRLSQATDDQAKSNMAAQIQALRLELSQVLSQSAKAPVTGTVTATKRERQRQRELKGQGQREGQGDSDSSLREGGTPPAAPRATGIPEGWQITDELREWAVREVPGLDIDRHNGRFVDHWRGIKHLAKGRKSDWLATWRNWMRTEHDRETSGSARPNSFAAGSLHGAAGFSGRPNSKFATAANLAIAAVRKSEGE